MQKAIYQKPFKTVAEQIALLEGRGLSVDIDASDFAAFLRSVNYYRFTGYQGNYTASYIQHLCVLRNLCAHHGRLYDHQWDYRFAALPEWKGLAVPKWRPFFYQCALVYRFLKPTEKFVFDRDGWKDRLCKLLGEIPQNPVFDAKARAAIPDNPANSPFWV